MPGRKLLLVNLPSVIIFVIIFTMWRWYLDGVAMMTW